MKRTGYLWDDVVDIDNIKMAIINASKGKRNRTTVKRCLNDIDETAQRVRDLLDVGYIPTKPTVRRIYDQNHKKERLIACPQFFPDQIIHHALMQVTIPVLQRSMYYHSYGSIVGKGSHKSVHRVEKWERSGKRMRYALVLDVRHFYENCMPAVLEDAIRRKIKDEKVIGLFMTVINSYSPGLPLGFYTSQWLGNFVLTPLDHFIKENGAEHYCRYMDDMLLLSKSKKRLHKLRRQIDEWLHAHGFELKQNWQVFKLGGRRPIDWLGYRIYRHKTTLRRSTFLRIRRRFIRVSKKKRITAHDAQGLMSYFGVIVHADSQYMRDAIPENVRKNKLRKVIRNAQRMQQLTA